MQIKHRWCKNIQGKYKHKGSSRFSTSCWAVACGLGTLAVAKREGEDTVGATISFCFLSPRGLSKDSSTVASEERKDEHNKDKDVSPPFATH